MSGNTMYLVCVHHPQPIHALVLSDRASLAPYEWASKAQNIVKFFEAHKHCGGGHDHFTIAYDRPKDYDLPTPAPLADAVHAVLRDPPDAANNGDAHAP